MAKKRISKRPIKNKLKRTSGRSPQGRLSKELVKDIWPCEHDVMDRPDRYRYVRKLIVPDACVFCQAQSMGPCLESLVVYQNSLAMVVLNKFPYNTGHTLIIPNRHCGELTQLEQEEYTEVMSLLRRAVNALQKSYGCPGLNIGLNQGSVAGAGIPEHLHWHIVPRWHGDTNFFPLIAETKVIPENLEQSYNRLAPLFKE